MPRTTMPSRRLTPAARARLHGALLRRTQTGYILLLRRVLATAERIDIEGRDCMVMLLLRS